MKRVLCLRLPLCLFAGFARSAPNTGFIPDVLKNMCVELQF